MRPEIFKYVVLQTLTPRQNRKSQKRFPDVWQRYEHVQYSYILHVYFFDMFFILTNHSSYKMYSTFSVVPAFYVQGCWDHRCLQRLISDIEAIQKEVREHCIVISSNEYKLLY